MKDRFKFRFWHTPSKKMLDCYGFNEHYTFADTLDGIGTEYNPCKTSDCVLMQCTGLRDNNGKLIYEGDIVARGEDKAVIKYDDETTSFYMRWIEAETFIEDCEVIGNIYENPELLWVDYEKL